MKPAPHQFALLRQRRFAPFFWTQFLGAANDNLFKLGFTILVTYQVQLSWLPNQLAGLVIGALFILPFLLFSATAGQLADKLNQASLMRAIKSLEIGIMLLGAWGLYTQHIVTLLVCIFLLGLHSTFFGPVKYAYLPQQLTEHELIGGNGLVEMGTFVAILLGTLAAGLIMATAHSQYLLAWVCLIVASLGRLAAQAIPRVPASAPDLYINWNPMQETWHNLKIAYQQPSVFHSLLGISWMWFFGSIFLAQFPAFTRDTLHGNQDVASLLLALFSVGIAIGSLLCEKLSRGHVEMGLVPIGALGMSLFAIDLYGATQHLSTLGPAHQPTLWRVAEFIAHPQHWRLMLDLILLALSAGLYSVPMYALIQLRSQPTHRARIIAANNILNALFMIISALFAMLLLQSGYSISQVFLSTGLLSIIVTTTLFLLVPEYGTRLLIWSLTHLRYRVQVKGIEHLPPTGPAILIGQQLSFVQTRLLASISQRPVCFLLHHSPTQLLRRRLTQHPVQTTLDQQTWIALDQALNRGDLICLCLDKTLAQDPHQLATLQHALNHRLAPQPVPVIPVTLHQFSAQLRLCQPVVVHLAAPITPEKISLDLFKPSTAQLSVKPS